MTGFAAMYELDKPEQAQFHLDSSLMELAMRIFGGSDNDPWGFRQERQNDC